MLSRREFIKVAIAGGCLFLCSGMVFGFDKNTQKPNILLIIDDQHNPRAMGWTGQSQAITPNLDRLAWQSVCFTNAYCANPVCAPTRHSIYTGLYSSEHGVIHNDLPMREGLPTLMAHLNRAGYTTANIGKMHNAPYHHRRDFQFVLNHEFYIDSAGISHYAPYLATEASKRGLKLKSWHRSRTSKKVWLEDPQRIAFISQMPEDLTAEHWITDHAINFMRDQLRNRPSRPFFLHASYFPPHHPYGPIEKYARMYHPEAMKLPPNFSREKLDSWCNGKSRPEHLSDAEVKRWIARYYGFVSQLDAQIGRLLDGLDQLGIEDNTIVIFTSDHGDMLGEHGRFYKSVMYEGSARVPFIVRWPGMQKTGKESALVSHVDIMPTLLRAAGLEPSGHLPGKDLQPLIRENGKGWTERSVYAESLNYLPFESLMLRKGPYKLIANATNTKNPSINYELYDLMNDPWELRNLAGNSDYSGKLKMLKDELTAIWTRQKKHMPPTIPGPMKRSRYKISWPGNSWEPVEPIGPLLH
jgi:choline-sulfatase